MTEEKSTFPIAPTPKPSAYDLECEARRAEPGGFGEWLDKNPPPDLQALVAKFGHCSKITPQAWAEHHALCDAWYQRYRARSGAQGSQNEWTNLRRVS
jgi:hypothetical protein